MNRKYMNDENGLIKICKKKKKNIHMYIST